MGSRGAEVAGHPLNVFKEELPSERESSFGWFALGLALYAALLALTTAFSESGGA